MSNFCNGVQRLVICQKKIVGVSEDGLTRFISRARKAAGLPGAVNVLITTSAEMRSLNSRFRGKNIPTDVLSFPSDLPVRRNGKPVELAGEIAISADIALQNAVRLGHPAATEVRILLLHGILHLAGFDHERDNGEMARKEAVLRQKLRLPVALIERTQAAPAEAKSAHRNKYARRAQKKA